MENSSQLPVIKQNVEAPAEPKHEESSESGSSTENSSQLPVMKQNVQAPAVAKHEVSLSITFTTTLLFWAIMREF